MNEVAQALHPIDLVVVALYFAVVIAIGIHVSRQTQTGEDLFLAGRSLGWFAIGMSLFASNISSTTLIGLTGSAYADGISVSAYEWVAGVPLIILAFVFVPMFLAARITTVPEYLEVRYDNRVRRYFSATTIALTVLVDMAGGLYAGAVVLRVFFPDVSLWAFCAAIGLFAGLYTATGGLRAVVYTDILQAVVLLVGSTALTIVMFGKLDYSWATVLASAPAEHFSVIRPFDDPQLPWPGLVSGVVLLGFWYWVTNQYIVQRVLGARDLRHAQWGAMFGGGLKLLPLLVMVLPGAMAISVYPDIANRDMVFPTMIVSALPIGLSGLVLAGLIAAIMSSVDSTLNASSTLIVHDFVMKDGEQLEPTVERRYGQFTTLAVMVVAIVWAPAIENFSGLWAYLQQVFSILVPPVAAIFLIGAFWKGATANGAFWALAVGHAIGACVFIATQVGLWPLHFTINVFVMTVVSGCVLGLVSKYGSAESLPRADQIQRGVWRPAIAIAPETKAASFLVDPRLHAALVLCGIVATVVVFW
ncbi:MAG: sodium/solute symporter [Pseudomonadota bacterium]